MAVPKLIIASLLLALVVVHQVQAIHTHQPGASNTAWPASEATYTPKMDCGGACDARCKLSSRPRLCKRACGTCCMRCNCVPPGTYGNYETCSCYAKMTTRNNKLKCP